MELTPFGLCPPCEAVADTSDPTTSTTTAVLGLGTLLLCTGAYFFQRYKRRLQQIEAPPPEFQISHPTDHNCHEILPGLYLGGIEAYHHADHNWTIISCMRHTLWPELQPYEIEKKGPHHLILEVNSDKEDAAAEGWQLFIESLPQVIKEINEGLAAKRNVLIHCRWGVSRSNTLLNLFLTVGRGMTPATASHLITAKRAEAYPWYQTIYWKYYQLWFQAFSEFLWSHREAPGLDTLPPPFVPQQGSILSLEKQ